MLWNLCNHCPLWIVFCTEDDDNASSLVWFGLIYWFHLQLLLVSDFWLTLMMWIFWEITDTIKKNRETLIDASNEVGLEINVEKTKYMLLSRHQNVGQNRNIKITNRSFENVSQFKYGGTAVTNQNLIPEEIKKRLNSGNAS
jgi:hypothetical protein